MTVFSLGVEDGRMAPQASYERRESVELAFTAACSTYLHGNAPC
jgi:hypothetical protein